MKNVVLLCLSFSIINFLSAHIPEGESVKKAGILSYLATVKALAEKNLLTLIHDTRYAAPSKTYSLFIRMYLIDDSAYAKKYCCHTIKQ